jgi:hypothetical protein
MRLTQESKEKQNAPQDGKLVVLRTKRPKRKPEVSQAWLKKIFRLEQRHALYHGLLMAQLQDGIEIEPGRFYLHGKVFHCERCNCTFAEEKSHFLVMEPKMAKLLDFDNSEYEQARPQRGCPRCYVRDHCPCTDCRKSRKELAEPEPAAV